MSILLRVIVFSLMCISMISLGYVKGKTTCEISSAKSDQAALQKEGKIDAKIMVTPPALIDFQLRRWTRG